ncbi:alpha/beta fold hydrolase [Gulosibacter molinativorax]|uniref:Alpha/beta hydrolase n=1 Tax=Gulosibacter molinativorax TaxID=256821 RepID=A0ABT7C8T7_9MICO|nr:alpha/beta hydrolase [Gulosibacter molinativorax]MDJ1371142.1 alpha/beta hydrolase [Gulosibacter molinativorax]QUY61502.1 Lipase 1 [Gulosibacter molinativorax]
MRPQNPLQARLGEIPVVTRLRSIRGSETKIWVFGPEDALQTVVLVHGFRGTHHGLANLVALLPEVRFIAPDLPGFGESTPMPDEHSVNHYATWLLELLREEDPDRAASVLGHSFGSMIVARAAADLEGRDVILVNPIAENALEGPARMLTNLGVFYYWAGAALPAPVGQALLASPVITRVMSEVMAVTRSRALRTWIHAEHEEHFSEFASRDVLLEAFRASVSTDVSAFAAELPAGTTMIAGERDLIAPLDATKRLHAKSPGSELHVIEGVGHLIHYETPIPLARLVREHLDRKALQGASID